MNELKLHRYQTAGMNYVIEQLTSVDNQVTRRDVCGFVTLQEAIATLGMLAFAHGHDRNESWSIFQTSDGKVVEELVFSRSENHDRAHSRIAPHDVLVEEQSTEPTTEQPKRSIRVWQEIYRVLSEGMPPTVRNAENRMCQVFWRHYIEQAEFSGSMDELRIHLWAYGDSITFQLSWSVGIGRHGLVFSVTPTLGRFSLLDATTTADIVCAHSAIGQMNPEMVGFVKEWLQSEYPSDHPTTGFSK